MIPLIWDVRLMESIQNIIPLLQRPIGIIQQEAICPAARVVFGNLIVCRAQQINAVWLMEIQSNAYSHHVFDWWIGNRTGSVIFDGGIAQPRSLGQVLHLDLLSRHVVLEGISECIASLGCHSS